MFGKVGYVAGVVAAVVAITVLLTIMMPTIKEMTDVAANDTTTGNYAGYQEAAASAPIWIYGDALGARHPTGILHRTTSGRQTCRQ
jgi:hypothetical protein